MAETVEKAVESLAVAKVGDHVLLFESQRANYINGKYLGRGVWRLSQITEETKQSFILSREKFDRKNGAARSSGGYNTSNVIAGEKERIDYEWSQYRYKIGRMVEDLRDANKLRQIAEIIGFTPSK